MVHLCIALLVISSCRSVEDDACRWISVTLGGSIDNHDPSTDEGDHGEMDVVARQREVPLLDDVRDVLIISPGRAPWSGAGRPRRPSRQNTL